jgi:acetate---CoA ligase (ADP-forming) subunit alpha
LFVFGDCESPNRVIRLWAQRHLAACRDIEPFFMAKSIAVIGASETPGKIGHEIVRNIKLSGYEGEVFPVNPKAGAILGFPCYKRVVDVPSSVDLALIVVRAELVEGVIHDCIDKHVKAAIIITSGFSEVGNRDLEDRIVSMSKSKLRIIGPNTFGVYSARNKMNATFGPQHVLEGKTAFITQSGALGLALMDWTTEEKYGVSSIVSIGNKSDVDDADLIEYLSEDPSTKSILIYMEGVKDGRSFFEASRNAVRNKPVVVIKGGRSARGAQAASSHTGSIAGQDTIFNAAFEQSGVMRADGMTQAFDWIQALNENPVPEGENVMIVTNGGGLGVLSTDKCEELGLKLMDLPEDLKGEVKAVTPSFGSIKNPIDLTANADDTLYSRVLGIILERKEVDAVIALFCQTANIDPVLVAQAIIAARDKAGPRKPITSAFVGGHLSQLAYSRMLEKKFAAYPTAERAVDAMYSLMARHRQLQKITAEGGGVSSGR